MRAPAVRLPTSSRGLGPQRRVSLVNPVRRMSRKGRLEEIPIERRVESFADDLNTRRGIVSGRVALLPRSTEIQPSSLRFVPPLCLSKKTQFSKNMPLFACWGCKLQETQTIAPSPKRRNDRLCTSSHGHLRSVRNARCKWLSLGSTCLALLDYLHWMSPFARVSLRTWDVVCFGGVGRCSTFRRTVALVMQRSSRHYTGEGCGRRNMSKEDCYLVDPASSHMLVSKIKPCMSRSWTLGWVDRSASGVHRSARPFCRRCAPGLNWPGRASGAVTLKKLECSKQAYALDTLAWDNIIGF
ncbi:hypothetical protein G2W53_040041 [Senna tora]|uniref:Uncharacterized protein n=1 Tax=Senna tora TaxID=362788 RepID=A0A834VZN1_9FABA|nr:hypothetical protein G2W53_045209 [Senna tora]KAF7800468.1 hypothetical protein G2W53_045124 [Senna tora]KAF7800496.1 hypothetical protein G2W53_045090 [Senna tora]KAF7800587.1 hypothetical protein G2W53_044981 [Senna tora]KAF7800602.1 hypothetical protein G2W53_044971 [Senna tora]